jgi:phosphoribosylformylglycinamidine synthase
MAFAGGLGVWIGLDNVPSTLWDMDDESAMEPLLLFSESNSRFLCEVPVEHASEFEALFRDVGVGRIGEIRDDGRMRVDGNSSGSPLIDAEIHNLKEAWQATFRW